MRRHRFDPVSVVVGAVFVAAAIIVLSGGRLTDEGRILLPIGLVAFGVALLGQAARPREHPAPAVAPVVSVSPVSPVSPVPEPVPPAEPVPPPADPGPAESDPALADADADADADPDVDAETAGPGTDFYFGSGWQPPRPDPKDEP